MSKTPQKLKETKTFNRAKNKKEIKNPTLTPNNRLWKKKNKTYENNLFIMYL